MKSVLVATHITGLAAGVAFPWLAQLLVGKAALTLPFILACLMMGLVVGSSTYLFVRRTLKRQMRQQLELLRPLAGEVAVADGTVEALQKGLETGVAQVEGLIRQLLTTVDQFVPLYHSLAEASHYLSERAREGLTAARSARGDVQALADKQQAVLAQVDQLSERSRGEGELSRELSASLEEMAEAMERSTEKFLETSTSVDQIAASLVEATIQAETIVRSVEGTSRNLDEIGDSLERIRSGASSSAREASTVSRDAASGLQVVQASMDEMERIEQESQRALHAMQRLSRQTGEVAKIIEVIKELVSDTELLAFNAAIIAAKAGEEGRGFAVVAEEIRDLADRTTNSAQDIHRIIQAIGGDTREVLEAVEATGMRIAKGKQLSLSTGEALRKIVGSSSQATTASEEIAELTGQQSERARALLADAGASLRSIRGITRAMQEQQTAIGRIQQGVGQMKEAADQIGRSMEEQVHANRQFDASLAERQEQVQTINAATRFQMETAQKVFTHFAASEKRLQGNAEKSAVITGKIADLEKLAGSLRTQIETFEKRRGGSVRLATSRLNPAGKP